MCYHQEDHPLFLATIRTNRCNNPSYESLGIFQHLRSVYRPCRRTTDTHPIRYQGRNTIASFPESIFGDLTSLLALLVDVSGAVGLKVVVTLITLRLRERSCFDLRRGPHVFGVAYRASFMHNRNVFPVNAYVCRWPFRQVTRRGVHYEGGSKWHHHAHRDHVSSRHAYNNVLSATPR